MHLTTREQRGCGTSGPPRPALACYDAGLPTFTIKQGKDMSISKVLWCWVVISVSSVILTVAEGKWTEHRKQKMYTIQLEKFQANGMTSDNISGSLNQSQYSTHVPGFWPTTCHTQPRILPSIQSQTMAQRAWAYTITPFILGTDCW